MVTLTRKEGNSFGKPDFIDKKSPGGPKLFDINEHYGENFTFMAYDDDYIDLRRNFVISQDLVCDYEPVSKKGKSSRVWQIRVGFNRRFSKLEGRLDSRPVVTTVPSEFWAWIKNYFAENKIKMTRHGEGYALDDCNAWESFPTFSLSIGRSTIKVTPRFYMYVDGKRFGPNGCYIDIAESKEGKPITIGPAILRNVFFHLLEDRVGTCRPRARIRLAQNL